MNQLLIDRCAEERNDLVLLHDLIHRVVQVADLAVKEADGEVLGPLARAEDPENADNDAQVVVLLDDLLPWVVRRLGRLVRRLASSQLDRGDEPVDDELEAEVEDGDDDEPRHDGHLQVNARLKLVDLVVMDAALLGLEEIASFVRILHQ